jgi:hypothetical protein
MNFFPPCLLFSLSCPGIHAKHLKIQLCHLVCIYFELDPHSFDFFNLIILKVYFVFYFVPHHLISLDFCIQYDSHFFYCYFFYHFH